MTTLVTGGAGFIGQHLVAALVAGGEQVRVIDSLSPPVHPEPTPPRFPEGVEFVRGDVADRADFRAALQGCTRVFHLAAYQDYLTDFSRFFHVNTEATALLFELAVTESLPLERVIVATSQAVYGEGRARCVEHGEQSPGQRSQAQLEAAEWELRCDCGRLLEPVPTAEDAPLRPHNSYGMSKRAQEETALHLGRRYGIPTVALRYSIVVGPGQSVHNAYSGALRSFTVRALLGQPPVIFEDGEQARDYVHIDDVVAATLMAGEDPRMDGEAYNVGGGRVTRVRELAGSVVAACGSSVPPQISGEFRVGDTRHIVSDVSKLRALGWEPRHSLEEAVAAYVDFARSQPALTDSFERSAAQMRALGVLRRVTGGD